MQPFDTAFRTLLLTRICGLTNENLLAYEGLVALQAELLQTLKVLEKENEIEVKKLQESKTGEKPPSHEKQQNIQQQINDLKKQIIRAGRLAHEIIGPFEKEFNALHELSIARRRLALRQRNYLQFPFISFNWKKFSSKKFSSKKFIDRMKLSWKKFIDWLKFSSYCSVWWNYRKTQFKTAKVFLRVRLENGWATFKTIVRPRRQTTKCGKPGPVRNYNRLNRPVKKTPPSVLK